MYEYVFTVTLQTGDDYRTPPAPVDPQSAWINAVRERLVASAVEAIQWEAQGAYQNPL